MTFTKILIIFVERIHGGDNIFQWLFYDYSGIIFWLFIVLNRLFLDYRVFMASNSGYFSHFFPPYGWFSIYTIFWLRQTHFCHSLFNIIPFRVVLRTLVNFNLYTLYWGIIYHLSLLGLRYLSTMDLYILSISFNLTSVYFISSLNL